MDDSVVTNPTSDLNRMKSILSPDQPEAPQASEEEAAPVLEEGLEVEPDTVETEEEVIEENGELYKVVVDGQEMEVPLEELIKGYQLEAHYTQKSQKLAEERKAVEAERQVLSGVTQKFEQLNDVVNYLTQVNNYVESTIPPEPSEDLLETSPKDYIKQQKARQVALQNLMAIQGTIEGTRSQAKAVVAELQKQGQVVLSQKMPELMTSEGANRLYGYLSTSYGYTPDQINQNIDPNLFIMAEKARRFDEMQSKVVKPVVKTQKVVKQVQKPRTFDNANLQVARQNFKSSGSVESAMPLIKNLLNNN